MKESLLPLLASPTVDVSQRETSEIIGRERRYILDTFVWYSPRYQWKHDRHEVMSWFIEAGLVRVEALPFPVAVKGQKARAESGIRTL